MGLRNSTARRRMNDPPSGEGGSGEGGSNSGGGEEGGDLASILSYLIRSGQVRIMTGGMYDDSDDEEGNYLDDDEDLVAPANPGIADLNPDTKNINVSHLKQEMELQAGSNCLQQKGVCVPSLLQNREIGMKGRQCFSTGDQYHLGCNFLPNHKETLATYHHKAFCGTYSKDGNIFLSACQDQHIRVYNTSLGQFRKLKTIRARDVGWSVLDTAFSPDGNYLIYSSWSDSIHICNIHGEHDTHSALYMNPRGHSSFCVFSLTFSSDNSEILAGANDGHLYVFDRERNERTLRIDAHEDDVNAVAFADSSSHILFSGGDDGLVRVWDRRTLREEDPRPVGTFAGHTDGMTFIDSRGDARHLISNSKDQSIKLWDMRRFSAPEAAEATRREVARQHWDYRWQQVPKKVALKKKKVSGDTSLMTYRGHSVLHTLVRCRFSPEFTTGQQYIYTGCATGAVIVYDVLTGKIVKKLNGHRACVRDVSWHPYEQNIISTSWDGTVCQWSYLYQEKDTEGKSGDEIADSEDEEDLRPKRRSNRLTHRFGGGRSLIHFS